jgi:hypothetical protein
MSASLSISHISKQLVRFRASVPSGVTLIEFVGLSAIAARPFAPTRTDPADRIHGWIIGLDWIGAFFSFPFFSRLIAFQKWERKYNLHSKPRGPLVLLPLYQESLTRLDYILLVS